MWVFANKLALIILKCCVRHSHFRAAWNLKWKKFVRKEWNYSALASFHFPFCAAMRHLNTPQFALLTLRNFVLKTGEPPISTKIILFFPSQQFLAVYLCLVHCYFTLLFHDLIIFYLEKLNMMSMGYSLKIWKRLDHINETDDIERRVYYCCRKRI